MLKTDSKLKRKISENECVLEEKLKEAELMLNLTLERNFVIEMDLMKVKKDLKKSMKWTSSSNLLEEMSCN